MHLQIHFENKAWTVNLVGIKASLVEIGVPTPQSKFANSGVIYFNCQSPRV